MSVYDVPEGWIIEYPEIAKIADQQMHIFWPWDEPAVENDTQDLRVHMSEADRYGLIEVLKLFTIYELRVGSDYWINRVARIFQRPEFQRLATMASCVEFNSHAPFYNRINEILYLDNEEFYSEWKHQEALSARMEFISQAVADPDDAKSIAAFSFIEGAVLYSNFAYIKHFQAQKYRKNLAKNVCRGVDLSVGDENLHSVAGAAIFNILCNENPGTRNVLRNDIYKMAQTVLEHEQAILDIVFEHKPTGITKESLLEFVKHRINLCLEQLGYGALYEVKDTTVQEWFYENINAYKLHDFFTGSGSEYTLKWKKGGFAKVWLK